MSEADEGQRGGHDGGVLHDVLQDVVMCDVLACETLLRDAVLCPFASLCFELCFKGSG